MMNIKCSCFSSALWANYSTLAEAFAVYRDTGVISKKFSIAWFVASWLIAICFVVIMLGQFEDMGALKEDGTRPDAAQQPSKQIYDQRSFVLASQIFPGPHSVTWHGEEDDSDDDDDHNDEGVLLDKG